MLPAQKRSPASTSRTVVEGPQISPQKTEGHKPARGQKPEDFRDKITDFIIRHRWASVVTIVLPLSKGYDFYWNVRHVKLRNLLRRAGAHDARVASVSAQIQNWNAHGRKGSLHTSRKGWQSVSVRAIDYKRHSKSGIAVNLHEILELDLTRNIVRVEPRANMAQLTQWLSARGLTLPVVPELDDLTVGGLILGYGIESSSHKYGLFADTVLSAEVVLADGRVVQASPSENRDLFYALPWSYGALGILTAVELPVIPAKRYVKVTYRPAYSHDEMCKTFTELVCKEQPPEFVDGLMFDAQRGVVVIGEFADLPPDAVPNRIGRFYKPWFYKHVESFLERGESSEYLPLRDYYHRYTRSLFFHGELLVPFGNHPLFRYTLGWLMPPKVSLMRLTQTQRMRRFRDERSVVQDALVPIRKLSEAVQLFHREFECFPLWLCAHKVFRTSPQGMLKPSRPDLDSEMFVDVGAWQVPGFVKRNEPWDARGAVKHMEAWLRQNAGYQCLYAVTEQSRAQFWEMFDSKLYRRVRKAYGAEGAFMDVFDKVKRPDQA